MLFSRKYCRLRTWDLFFVHIFVKTEMSESGNVYMSFAKTHLKFQKNRNNYLCTYDLYSPVHNAFDAGSIRYEGKWEGVGPWKSRVFQALEWQRADRQVPLGTQKNSRFRGPKPLHASEALRTRPYKSQVNSGFMYKITPYREAYVYIAA